MLPILSIKHKQQGKQAFGEKDSELKQKLTKDPKGVESSIMYYISLPTEDAHHGHPTGSGVAGFSQQMNEKVAAKLGQIVGEGITEIKQVYQYYNIYVCYIAAHHVFKQNCKCNILLFKLQIKYFKFTSSIYSHTQVRSLLRHYMMNELCKNDTPSPNDRAYFPLDTDLKNHIFRAKRALQLSCLDQENVHLLVERWKKTDPGSNHVFRPYIHADETAEVKKTDETPQPAFSSLTCIPEEEQKDTIKGNDGKDDHHAITDSDIIPTNTFMGIPDRVAEKTTGSLWKSYDADGCHVQDNKIRIGCSLCAFELMSVIL